MKIDLMDDVDPIPNHAVDGVDHSGFTATVPVSKKRATSATFTVCGGTNALITPSASATSTAAASTLSVDVGSVLRLWCAETNAAVSDRTASLTAASSGAMTMLQRNDVDGVGGALEPPVGAVRGGADDALFDDAAAEAPLTFG